jgi:hypothetical protein
MTDAHVKKPDVPDVLYRGFEVLDHARAFVDEGIIRFGRLDLYCNLEDPRRRDPGEGIARLRMPMPDSQDVADFIPTECNGRNWTYALCTSAADQGYVASKFGRYVVRINNPGERIADIRDHLSSNPIVPNPSVDPRWVTYNRGDAATRSLDADELLTLSYSQKSASFVDDQEYRIVILSLLSYQHRERDPMAASNIFLRLNRRLSCCDVLQGLIVAKS